MKQFKAEIARPDPKSTINSYRSFGYNLPTALADIIDNSISAGAKSVHIDCLWKGKDSNIVISDDGSGMSLEELILAMTPGSKNPDDHRDEKDLGRFGMGLKTSSFSQCKRLTVSTKKNGTFFNRCWDIDFINDEEEWTLLDYISNESFLQRLDGHEQGTVIIWEKLDRIVGSASEDNEAVKAAFYREITVVKEHLSMVFHRFLEQNQLKIFMNGTEIVPWDPFLLNLNPKPEMGPKEVLEGNVEVTYYILPHMSRISHEDYQKSGGPLGWFQQQGFYIYRGNRLLVSGNWLDIEKQREYSKLVRISINFPNTTDFAWNLDIKKSTATPPVAIRKDLRRIARVACQKSAQIYNWRGQRRTGTPSSEAGIQSLWFEETTRENVKKYKINKKHALIKKALEYDKSGKNIFSKALKLIEENVPVELILYNQNEDPSYHEIEKIPEIPDDALINLAVELYRMNVQQGVPEELAAQQIMNAVPFSQFPLINDYLK